jgi:competence protein ComEA
MTTHLFKTGLLALALAVGAPAATIAADKPAVPTPHSQPARKAKQAVQPTKVIDVNSASKAELTKLWGIDAAAADRIIAGRPYRSKADLASRKIIPKGIYFAIHKRIMAKQPLTAAQGSGRK